MSYEEVLRMREIEDYYNRMIEHEKSILIPKEIIDNAINSLGPRNGCKTLLLALKQARLL